MKTIIIEMSRKGGNVIMSNDNNRPIYQIANEIQANWQKVYFGAKPYLQAMKQLNQINDSYGCDSAKSIIIYFLANAATWRGETAKRIKNELKKMTKN